MSGCRLFSKEKERAMVGDKLGNLTGKVMLRRVLPSPGQGAARTETTQRGTGTLLGVEFQDMSTYESEVRPDGTLYGSGQGVCMGKGGALATWVGHGVATVTKGGGSAFRGAIFFYSTSPAWQRLNGVAALFEYDVAPDDSYTGAFTEWK
jgi:hypothetical protein